MAKGLPRLAGALAWLVLGWVAARIAQVVLGGLLHRIGLDKLVERAGASELLESSGFKLSASKLFARLVYWALLLIFVLAALESLGLSQVVDTLNGIVNYLPNVLAAILILLFGGFLARVAGDAINRVTTGDGFGSARLLGGLVYYAVLAFTAIQALQQLQIQTTLLVAGVIAILAAIALTLALSFGLGNRDLARNIMAGFHARELFAAGQELKIGEHTGRLLSIETVKAVIETEAGLLSLPNTALLDEEVTILSASTDG